MKATAEAAKPASRAPVTAGRGNRFSKGLKSNLPFFLMMLPGVIVLIINNYIPMIGVLLPFKKYKFENGFFQSIFNSEWVGLDNFKFLFSSPNILQATRNTVLYNLVFIALQIIIPVVIAIALTEMWHKGLSRFFQSALFLPYFLSWIIVSYLAYSFLSYDSGFINGIFKILGLEKVNWYYEVGAWPFFIVFFQVWKYCGYNIVIFIATISGISDDYYEAATLDGATKFQQVRYITLPMLKTVIIITTLFAVGKIFNSDFGLFFSVPRNIGALYPVTNTIDTLVYIMLRNSNNVGMTAAASLYQAVVGCITVFIANGIVRKFDKEQALF
ncbi:ABC transporter permease [Acetanaerobacterium elongatum]|uniref:Carbohydrate ABC transporter membrane protein 1, CUT1 family n=1 Tax=Acetanaerobacterium elongatum TaxID=258515 RepID=A0A1G9W9E7_9FIRM|nr:ABC transporter permease subunit [Acetanaerobacterium elongatum]SDM81120.1 carbohydrate ABC transporter membrane protein 1, CUT1 family [Acetanaerobacterium elongatum]